MSFIDETVAEARIGEVDAERGVMRQDSGAEKQLRNLLDLRDTAEKRQWLRGRASTRGTPA